MICSKAKLGPEADTLKQLLIENGYPADVLFSCINQKLANFAVEKPVGTEKCLVYLKVPWNAPKHMQTTIFGSLDKQGHFI